MLTDPFFCMADQVTPDLRICAVGDISFEGRLSDQRQQTVFSEVVSYIQGCDLGIANLENPLTTQRDKIPGKCTLRGNPGWAEVLKETGINMVSLANNHMMDYGPEGLFETIRALDSAGIMHLGAGSDMEEALLPLFVKIKGRSIAFLARSSVIVTSPSYAGPSTPGVAFLETEELVVNINRCKEEADLVIVILHWGLEEYRYPAPVQVCLAGKLIDAGVDVIVGHHPHVLQGMQHLKRGIVYYSLGNFLFNNFKWNTGLGNSEMMDFNLSEDNRKGMILQFSWDEKNNLNTTKIFTRINSDGFITDDNAFERAEEFNKMSACLDKSFYAYWWRLYSLSEEWQLRIRQRMSPRKIMKNFWKIRPRHFLDLVRTLRKSVDISTEKTTNPYE